MTSLSEAPTPLKTMDRQKRRSKHHHHHSNNHSKVNQLFSFTIEIAYEDNLLSISWDFVLLLVLLLLSHVEENYTAISFCRETKIAFLSSGQSSSSSLSLSSSSAANFKLFTQKKLFNTILLSTKKLQVIHWNRIIQFRSK